MKTLIKPFLLVLIMTFIFSSYAFSERKSTFGRSFTNSIDQKFVYIKPGSFMMGSNIYKHVHKATLTHGFYMQTTEVTQKQWVDIMGTKPWANQGYVKENNYPAVCVSWFDTKVFIERLIKVDGKKYRLPTEAEWEYVCRAGSSSKYCFGNNENLLGKYAWYKKNAGEVGENYARSVGTKKPNQWGLFDMHGNVFEWCEDWFVQYYSNSPITNPIGPSSGSLRVVRSSGLYNRATSCSSASRDGVKADMREGSIGFRLVCLP